MGDKGSSIDPVASCTLRMEDPPARSPRIRLPNRFLTSRSHEGSSGSSFPSSLQEPISFSRSDVLDPVGLNESRRRAQSFGLESNEHERNTVKKPSVRYGSRRRSKRASQGPRWSGLMEESLMPDFQPGAFSDEYDLSQEDPKILQDVQRALQLQSRRRDRRSYQAKPSDDDTSQLTNVVDSFTARPSSSSTTPMEQSTSDHLLVTPLPSDVDFSPLTKSVPLHPVPLSSNGGATLDWAGSQSEDEKLDKLWPIHKGRRKGKEKAPPANRAFIEKQEALFIDRIARIKAEASATTVRKAVIVKEQLGRQYSVVFSSIANGLTINLAEVVRWYFASTLDMRAWLDGAEPLTWLKHLLDNRGNDRVRWRVSALLMEEYARFKKGVGHGQPSPIVGSTVSSPSFPSYLSPHIAKSPISITASSDASPSTSASKARLPESHISFSPLVANSRNSIDDSQGHGHARIKGWRRSLPTFIEGASARVNPFPYSAVTPPGSLSPASSHFGFRDAVRRFPEEGSSSAHGSQSEDQNDSSLDASRLNPRQKREPRFLLRRVQPSRPPSPGVNDRGGPSDPPPPVASRAEIEGHIQNDTVNPEALPSKSAIVDKGDSTLSGDTPPKPSYRSISLPLGNCMPFKPASENDEGKLEAEYGLRWRILEELKGHNHRLRHRLQRVAADIREYEILCSNALPTLGISYRSLPPELLDAIGHDPSSVTGGTRKYRGWQAVEDVHDRVTRQREIIRLFLSTTGEDALAIPDILDKPITLLMEKLQAIQRVQQPLNEKADDVNKILAEVRSIHATVKREYNEAVSHTSVVYPELSHVVALVEKYQDQYQQIWEFGMDVLTFVLDTITPFWRNYGKTIMEDIQDFLIIPWYRNEFTGEPKRYPVESLPRRSVRHWFSFLGLFAFIILITFLQARAAITSTWHYRLLWIDNHGIRWAILPLFWVAIVIQWVAVIIELCIVFLHAAVVSWWLGWLVGLCT
ncbi:hypothetical protein BKA82DRAFT_4095625 [Pisolithus tinctorius]|nr:hypothetical protein BKA82DRAFT_4095625 [Pisolithus tinctorius]